MAGKRDYENDQDLNQHSEPGYDYQWNQWYSYPPYGYYPSYGAARVSPGHSQCRSQAQCGLQSALSNQEDNDGSDTESDDENVDAPSSSQKVDHVDEFLGHTIMVHVDGED